jgi:non-heme chloroperoxidase
MQYIKTNNSGIGEEVNLYYEDLGQGKPIVFIHGWPLSQEMWEYQVGPLVEQGFRCITYDRRGFGRSSRPLSGYDYDTMTDDLKALLEQLDLRDVTLVGFSMGGGEVARYFSRHGGDRVSKAVLISAVTPYMLKTQDNGEGVDGEVFEGIMKKIKEDRISFLADFGKDFYGVSLLSNPVSDAYLENDRNLAAKASPIATQQCAVAFAQTDFRADLPQMNVPTLIIHGDADKTVPIEVSSDRSAQMIPNCQYIVYSGAPHGLFFTNKEQLNSDLVDFINS